MEQTWIKTDEGYFIAVDKITHVVVDTNGKVSVYVVSGNWAGTFPSTKAFFEAMQRGLSEEDVNG